MSDEFFDLDRLRRKWVAEPTADEPVAHARLENIDPIREPEVEVKALVVELRATLQLRFPEHRRALEHLLDAAAQLFERGAKPAEILDALDRIEDLVEALLVALPNARVGGRWAGRRP